MDELNRITYNMSEVKTYVFFDLETTGLPSQEGNRTRITELCFIAVKRNHLINTKNGETPRVQNKLTLCINPGKDIGAKTKEITHLDNELLESESHFDERVFKQIENFLNLQIKPVCLIAHNGLYFDYPILKNHLDGLNVSFPEDLLCSDSIFGFYDLENGIESGAAFQAGQRWPWGKTPRPLESYSLPEVYRRIFNSRAEEAHRAEADCVLMLKCAVHHGLIILTGLLWGCTNPFIRQGTKGLRNVHARTWIGQAWAEVAFLLGNWKYVLPWLVNQAGSLSYLLAVRRAPLTLCVPAANALAFASTAVTGAAFGKEEPLDLRSILGITCIVIGTALCCWDKAE